MKQNLQIKVEVPSCSSPGQFKTLFRNTIEIDDSVAFDYGSLISGIKLLFFGNNKIIINLTLL